MPLKKPDRKYRNIQDYRGVYDNIVLAKPQKEENNNEIRNTRLLTCI